MSEQWEVQVVEWYRTEQLNAYLEAGWEPFAGGITEYSTCIFLRRRVAS